MRVPAIVPALSPDTEADGRFHVSSHDALFAGRCFAQQPVEGKRAHVASSQPAHLPVQTARPDNGRR